MFQSDIEEAKKAWVFYDQLTLLYSYKMLQRHVIDAYTPYRDIVERYSKTAKRKIQAVTEEYLEEHPEVAEQNVALLKNAMELWRVASQTSAAVAPMLYHYSWHCFNSFFMYTFFRWKPQHCGSHGVSIVLRNVLKDNIEDVKIQILKRKDGLFQRLIDTWTLLGASLAFSPFLPVFQENEINFVRNDRYLLNHSNELSLKQLLTFNSGDFERALYSDRREELLNCPFWINSIMEPTKTIKSYLVVFAASSLARYRPILWNSVLVGKTQEQSNLATQWSMALSDYTIGSNTDAGFLYQISGLLTAINVGQFGFKRRGRKRI